MLHERLIGQLKTIHLEGPFCTMYTINIICVLCNIFCKYKLAIVYTYLVVMNTGNIETYKV